jgi:hypothetical protein
MKLTDYITYTEPMKRFREFWTANIGQTQGTGPTREDATKNLFDIVKKSLNGNFIPAMIFHHGYVALIWREGQHWYYTIRKVDESGPVMSNIHCIGDRQATEMYARHHLAAYVEDEGGSPEEAAEIITDELARKTFLDQCYHTKRVQALMAEHGLDWQTACQVEDGLKPLPARVEK